MSTYQIFTFMFLLVVIKSKGMSEPRNNYPVLVGSIGLKNIDLRNVCRNGDIRTNGVCCFNHIIGLPQKDGVDKPLYGYEEIIFDSLVTQTGDTLSCRLNSQSSSS